MKLTKAIRALPAVALLATLLTPVVGTTPASALSEEAIVFAAREGATFKKSYGPIPPNDTLGEFHQPGDCADVPFCVEIPLQISLPSAYDPDLDEFIVPVVLSWDQSGPSSANDLDMYIYLAEKNEDDEWVEVQSGATAAQPEEAKMFQPDKGNYIICISNFAGVNQGFTLELSFKSFRIDVPDEDDYAPRRPSPFGGPAGPNNPSGGGPSAAVVDPEPIVRTPSSPSFLPFSAPEIAPADVPTIAVVGDLPGFGSAKSFDDVLEGDDAALDILEASRRQLGPPEPVGAAIVFFWAVAVPVALVAAAVVLMMRRRPAALRITAV